MLEGGSPMNQNMMPRFFLVVAFLFLVFAFPQAALGRSYFNDTFGMNNPSQEMELIDGEDLAGLNIGWISDGVARSKIEYEEDGEVKYDWTSLNEMLNVYVDMLDMHLWLVVNPVTAIKTSGAKKYKKGKFLPIKDEAMDLYTAYLKALVSYTKHYKPGFRVSYWSVYNEPHGTYFSIFGKTDEGIDKAAKAYVRLVKKTYKIIRTRDPGARVVLGGVGSAAGPKGYQFYHKVLERLDELDPKRENNGYFDFFDYHDYNYFDKYKTNRRGYGYNWFRREVLKPYGFFGKVIVIKEGATHTGKDLDANGRLDIYQSESDQAEYAIKRAVFNHGKSVRNVQWSTLREHGLFQGSYHVNFCYNGFIFNGSPTGDEEWFDPVKHIADPKIIITQEPSEPDLYTFTTAIFREGTGWDYKTSVRTWEELEGALSPEQQDELLATGSLEIGDGIKKLAYYTYKFMVDKLRDCDLRQMDTLRRNDEDDSLYLYEFWHTDGTPIYVAWWDWFKEPGVVDKTTTFHLNLPTPNSQVRIINAIPTAESGADAEIFLEQYPDFFSTATALAVGNQVVVTLDRIPVYIEPL